MTKQDLINSLVTITNETSNSLLIDMPYCDAAHPENVFQTAFYKKEAPFVLTQMLAEIVLDVAHIIHEEKGWYLSLKDGLRPIEAQQKMNDCPIVQANPQWENILISKPGSGGHPRGCAVDVTLLDADKNLLDMGTPFDFLSPDLENNPAKRDYKNLAEEILERRHFLTTCFITSAKFLKTEIFPLPSEWWDYRLPLDIYKDLPALSNDDLPAELKLL